MNLLDKVNKKLKEYVENEVFPLYEMNGEAHGVKHIEAVIERSFEIIEEFEEINDSKQKINYNMSYVIAAYHDIGEHVDRKNHHIISGKIMFEDKKLDEFFSLEEKTIMKEAIEDHRASNKHLPRSIYGRIVLTADRNNNLIDFFKRRVQYCLEHNPEFSLEEVQEELWKSSKEKFGREGYAKNKPGYMSSKKLAKYFQSLERVLADKDVFFENVKKVYKQWENRYKEDEKDDEILKEIEIDKNILRQN